MSHNQIKVANQTVSANGDIDLNLSNIVSFTSTSSKFLGVDASNNLVQSDTPTLSGSLNWTPVLHYFASLQNWGGPTPAVTVGSSVYFRKPSGHWYLNSSYALDTWDGTNHWKWGNRFTIQPGTYLFNFNFVGRVVSSSDEVIVRLKNITDDTFTGNRCYWGSQKYSSNSYVHVTIGNAKQFSIIVTSVSGSPLVRNSTSLLNLHLNIWRIT